MDPRINPEAIEGHVTKTERDRRFGIFIQPGYFIGSVHRVLGLPSPNLWQAGLASSLAADSDTVISRCEETLILSATNSIHATPGHTALVHALNELNKG